MPNMGLSKNSREMRPYFCTLNRLPIEAFLAEKTENLYRNPMVRGEELFQPKGFSLEKKSVVLIIAPHSILEAKNDVCVATLHS